ncbi:MAG: class I SAM-dependent methyltransferase, partial [Longimicrobiales bacterium]
MVTRLGTGDLEFEPVAPDEAARRTLEVVADLFGPRQRRAFSIRLWNGVEERGGEAPPRFVLVLNRPEALRRILLPATERRVAEAYIRRDVDIEGDLEAATALGETLAERPLSVLGALRLVRRLLGLPSGPEVRDALARFRARSGLRGRHSRARDVAAIRHHYDVGNDFYSLWLDDRMVYSCGYFPTGGEDLNAAQEAKLELVCRKLRLEPGDRLLDIGCGWGGL